MDEARTAVQQRADRLEQRAKQLNTRELKLDKRAAALTRDERQAEQRAAMTQIDAGVYEVGVDMEPGTYKSSGGGTCYWARLQPGSQDIIDNHFGPGQAVATVNAGELFETQGCDTFHKQ